MLIEQVDARFFAFLNQQLVHPAADDLFVFLTKANLSRHIFVLAALFMLVRGGRRGMIAVFLALLAVGLADFIASGMFKPLLGRIRPCFALEHVRLLIDQSRSFSLPLPMQQIPPPWHQWSGFSSPRLTFGTAVYGHNDMLRFAGRVFKNLCGSPLSWRCCWRNGNRYFQRLYCVHALFLDF